MRNPFSLSYFDRILDFFTCSGDDFKPVYSSQLLPDGSITLKETDKINIQQKIDSYRDSTDMAYILDRLGVGDTSVLSVDKSLYGDFTSAPKSLAEAMQLCMDAEVSFDHLPLDVRSKFNFNYRNWILNAGSKAWLEAMGFDRPLADGDDSIKEAPVNEP